MFLKRLEIRGFKSFADKTELDFPNGITAVVGPNGSGKSNIADAVRWVLGEQSAKSLRGYKMEDVIFAGSDSRKPINYAEVTLVLDNEQQTLPLDYSEVAVTRKVYRSGDSEYLINNQSCRLKDITELFMDTGLGKEAYSIIGQGRIEEILSTKSEERRGIFEEAAGIVKYKTRKREAVKRLEETEANLVRVHDVMNELEDQIDPLKEASATAETYLSFKSELKSLDISLHAYQIKIIDNDWNTITLDKQLFEDQLSQLTTELNSYEANYTELKWNLTKCEQEIDQLQQQFTDISTNLEKSLGDKKVLLERKKNIQDTIDNFVVEIQNLEQNLKSRRQSVEQKQKDYEHLKKQFEHKKSQLQSQIDQLETYETNLEIQDAQTEILKGELIDILHNETTIKNDIHHLQQSINQITNKLTDLKSQIHDSNIQLNSLENQIQEININISSVERAIIVADEQFDKKQLEQKHCQNILGTKIQEHQNQKQLLITKQDRMHLLAELEADYAGYFQGTKEILIASDKNTEQFRGVKGAVVDLIQTPQAYEVAIETALGSALQHIVVDNEKTAQASIQYLKTRGKGRATFLPISIIKGNARRYPNCENLDGFIGYADELISTSQEYSEIISSLLGNVIITKDMSSATKIANVAMYKCRIVTLDGDYISPGGSMTGGSNQRKGSSLISRKNEIIALESEIDKLIKQIAATEQQCNAQQSELEQIQLQLTQIAENREKLRSNYTDYQAELKQIQQECLYRNNNLQMLIKEEEHFTKENISVKDKISSQEINLQQLIIKQQEIEHNLQQYQQQLKLQTLEKNSASSKVTEVKVELAKYEEQLNTLSEIHQRDLQELKDLDMRLNKLLNQEKEQQEQFLLVESELGQREEQLITQEQLKVQLSSKIDDQRITRKRMQDQVTEQEAIVSDKSQKCKTIEKQLHQLEVKINRYDVELNNALNQLQQEYEISYERAIEEYPLQSDPDLTKKTVQELKRKIAALGVVNVGAIEEYQRVNERYHFLKTQREDLQEATNKLYQVIREMNEEMEKRFIDSFNLIKHSFAEVFQQMFGGGRASLQLSDLTNVLASGIEIYAEPPGKKLQHLSLLSGGERALTAIALLFAILKVSPVPFCILDEVEAALDESNVTRFANYLRKFCSNTQFIVVTHRKGTMEAADVLYGVTMEGSGVSKMISVKLEEAVKLNATNEQIEAS